MKILRHLEELSTVQGDVYLAIGVFDGLHLGHQAVIRQAIIDAKNAGGNPVMLTFHPHPLRVLQPNRAPHLLTSTPHKERLAAHYGLPFMLELEFDQSLAETTPETFIHALVSACCKDPAKRSDAFSKRTDSSLQVNYLKSSDLRQVYVGHQWTFGKNRSGNVNILRQLGERYNFAVVEVPQVLVDGKIVSSTRIRTAISEGNFSEVERCLGRPYTILGDVVHGAKLGHSLGYPTANLATHSEQFPPDGVYVVEVYYSNHSYQGVANIGNRPTVSDRASRRTLEVHLINFAQDLYGQQLELRFLHFVRPERKFPSLKALQEQISADIARAQQFFQHPEKNE